MKNNKNEFLAALYLLIFALAKMPIKFFPQFSFYILLGCSIIIFGYSIILNSNNKTITLNKNLIITTIVISIITLISIIFNNNPFIFERFYEFIIYGFINIYLFTKIKNFQYFLKMLANISVFTFFLYFSDPFNNYYFFSGYMPYGLNCMLPIFCFCCIGRKVFKNKIYLIIEILTLVELLLFCNRGSLITAITLEFILLFTDNYVNYKTILKYIFIFSSILIIYFNLNNILLFVIDFLNKHNMNSYSILAFYNMFNNITDGLAGRNEIWTYAIDFFKEKPLLGHGIGAFETFYGNYTHNIILEILTSYGIIGCITFIILLLIYIYKFIKSKNESKYIYLIFLVVGIVPLMFSIYTFKWQYFWLFIYLAISKNINNDLKLNTKKNVRL